jgi:hypothetical protein
MRHPSEGVLRRLLDEPAGVSDPDRAHVADCEQCLRDLTVMQQDAALVGATLATDDHHDADVAAAWQRLSTAGPGRARPPARRARRFHDVLRRPAFAGLAVGLVLAGAGTAAANDWLPIFRTEKVAPVSFSTEDLVALPDLRAYGTVLVSKAADVHDVPDAVTAAAESGLQLPVVADLPDGVIGQPRYQVGKEVSATFTFSAELAARAAQRIGKALPPPPPGLDGSSVRLVAGPGVAQTWGSSSGLPALVVGRAVAPKAFSSGVPFETVRDYVLSMPGLPGDVAAQLRSFTADGSTLPLPVPVEQATSTSTEVDGEPATLLRSRDKAMAAVVWVKEGVVTVVAGSLNSSEVLTVARELR